MKKILYFMIGMPSCYNSGITLAKRLRDAGIEVVIACDADISQLLSESGLEFHHLQESKNISDALVSDVEAHGYKDRFRSTIYKLKQHLKYRKQSLEAKEILGLCDKVSPDALLIDIEFHYAIVASRKLGIPCCLISRWFSNQRSPGVPPLHSISQPASGILASILIDMEWMKLSVLRLRKALVHLISIRRFSPVNYRTISGVDLNALATTHNVSLKEEITHRDWLIPHAYTQIPVVSLTAQEMDFPKVATKNFHYAGPMVGSLNYAFVVDRELATRLDTFIANSQQLQQKVIYCSLGTFLQSDSRFVDSVMQLAVKRSDLAFILTLGGLSAPSSQSLSGFPSNMVLVESAPQIELLKRVDAAILHAGIALSLIHI